MPQPTVDQRITALEQQVARLTLLLQNPQASETTDWRSTIGMFAGDPIMKEIIEEGRKIRERDRESTAE